MFKTIAAAAAALVCVVAEPALAADVSAYGRLPAIADVTLSPSGARLAYITTIGDQRKLVVLDLPDKVLMNVPVSKAKVRGLNWAGDSHLLVTISNTRTESFDWYQQEFAQVLSVNVDTQKTFAVFADNELFYHAVFGQYGVSHEGGRWYGYFGGVALEKPRGMPPILGHTFADLYKVDLDTAQVSIVAHGGELHHNWQVDDAGNLVAYSIYDKTTGSWTLYSGDPSHRIITKTADPLGDTYIDGLGRTPGTVIVYHHQPEEWAVADGSHRALPVDNDAVIDGDVYEQANSRLFGVNFAGDTPESQFFEPALQARYKALQKALGQTIKVESWSSDFKRLVVKSEGKGDSGTYWLIDGGQANIIDNPYPDVAPASVGESRVISYKAADGLEIKAILTLPPGRAAKNLPVVVMPHGGPIAHDAIGFDWMAQAFAAQGYAVLQPNFRGSDGYTVAFQEAGYGQWGRKMQTDLSDGVAELARQGVVDPKRACIVGGSYGGYAALAGVSVQHGVYRCAAAWGGISDLGAMTAWEVQHSSGPDAETRSWKTYIGATSAGDPVLREISPAKLAATVDGPVLLMHGTDDTVVPIEQSQMMQKALQAAGKPVEMITVQNEDHWLSHEAGRKQWIQAAVDFVMKHNPPDPAPAPQAAAASGSLK